MVVINMSLDCTASCPNCPYVNNPEFAAGHKSLYMKDTLFTKIATEVGKHGSWLRLSGREPLMHPNAYPLISYAKYAGCKVGLNTNGMNLTINFLLSGVDAVMVSVDAGSKPMYGLVRPGLDWDRLVENVFAFRRLRDKIGADTVIIASIVDQKILGDSMYGAVKFWGKMVDKVMVRKFLTWGVLNPTHSGNPAPYLDDTLPCPFAFERLNIDTDGTVAFCGYDVFFKNPVGDVMGESIKDVWDRMSETRDKMEKEGWDKVEMCRDCTDRKYRSWNYNWWKVVEDAKKERRL